VVGVTVVVKIGGARAVDPQAALTDVAHLTANGEDVVVVHGGSTAVDDLLEQLGEEPEYVETPDGVAGRFTDETTMDAFEMALPGKVNTDLVADLQNAGVNAVGLSGADGRLLTGERKSAVKVVEDGRTRIRRGDHAGTVEAVNADLLETLLAGGYTPVVTVPVLADDGAGEDCVTEWLPVNADADRAAAAVAAALDAELVVLTDVDGVYADPDDPETVIGDVATEGDFEDLEAAAEGFMTRKVMAAEAALTGGAAAVHVAGADRNSPILSALSGGGTTVLPGGVGATGDADRWDDGADDAGAAGDGVGDGDDEEVCEA
jgi:acetylglutamate/LysW-gamma-L-alpha-aminoadipate kinase